MKQLNRIFTRIVSEHLNIPTLRTRKSDSLNFHQVSVWAVRSALKAAYDLGVSASQPQTPAQDARFPTPFDDYEIHGMTRLTDIPGQEEEPAGRLIDNCEQVSDNDAEFWSLFGHIPGQGIDCIGDFATREHAEEIFARITGRRYADATLDHGKRRR
jgi:hypothetical protein